MKKDPVIYKIRNKKNGKLYFGQTVNFNKRMNEYKNRLYEKSSKYYIMNIINTEGIENFTFEIVEHCKEDDLNSREMYYIKKHNTTNPLFGYNSQKGEKDKRMFKRTRKLMSKSHTGLKEKSSTKRKKSNPVIAINDKEVIICDSGKLFGDYIGKSKDLISHAISQPHNILGYYVFSINKDKQNKILQTKIINSKYLYYLNIINSSLETIEKHYRVRYIHYSD